jgi:hypothetical protein
LDIKKPSLNKPRLSDEPNAPILNVDRNTIKILSSTGKLKGRIEESIVKPKASIEGSN